MGSYVPGTEMLCMLEQIKKLHKLVTSATFKQNQTGAVPYK